MNDDGRAACQFCRIIDGDRTGEDVRYESDDVLVIDNIAKRAPIHVLVIPKGHVEDPDNLDWSRVMDVAAKYGRASCPDGFRLLFNYGEDGCQNVAHLHIHILGGERVIF